MITSEAFKGGVFVWSCCVFFAFEVFVPAVPERVASGCNDDPTDLGPKIGESILF